MQTLELPADGTVQLYTSFLGWPMLVEGEAVSCDGQTLAVEPSGELIMVRCFRSVKALCITEGPYKGAYVMYGFLPVK